MARNKGRNGVPPVVCTQTVLDEPVLPHQVLRGRSGAGCIPSLVPLCFAGSSASPQALVAPLGAHWPLLPALKRATPVQKASIEASEREGGAAALRSQ